MPAVTPESAEGNGRCQVQRFREASSGGAFSAREVTPSSHLPRYRHAGITTCRRPTGDAGGPLALHAAQPGSRASSPLAPSLGFPGPLLPPTAGAGRRVWMQSEPGVCREQGSRLHFPSLCSTCAKVGDGGYLPRSLGCYCLSISLGEGDQGSH